MVDVFGCIGADARVESRQGLSWTLTFVCIIRQDGSLLVDLNVDIATLQRHDGANVRYHAERRDHHPGNLLHDWVLQSAGSLQMSGIGESWACTPAQSTPRSSSLITRPRRFCTHAANRGRRILLQEADFVEVYDNVTGVATMKAKKRQLAGSFRGQVVCYERDFGPDNVTLTDWQLDWTWIPASKDNPIPISTPPYAIIYGIGAFFFYSYAFGLPLYLGIRLYFGRHRLNDLRFGRKFGYLYKRYEAGWYAWELVVMARKVSLAVIQVCSCAASCLQKLLDTPSSNLPLLVTILSCLRPAIYMRCMHACTPA